VIPANNDCDLKNHDVKEGRGKSIKRLIDDQRREGIHCKTEARRT
jgi:hypothetical protein